MSKEEIIAELPRLEQKDRREIARLIFEMDEDRQIQEECDRLADERFQMLDRLEESDSLKTRIIELLNLRS